MRCASEFYEIQSQCRERSDEWGESKTSVAAFSPRGACVLLSSVAKKKPLQLGKRWRDARESYSTGIVDSQLTLVIHLAIYRTENYPRRNGYIGCSPEKEINPECIPKFILLTSKFFYCNFSFLLPFQCNFIFIIYLLLIFVVYSIFSVLFFFFVFFVLFTLYFVFFIPLFFHCILIAFLACTFLEDLLQNVNKRTIYWFIFQTVFFQEVLN